jgi:hypothetical protein
VTGGIREGVNMEKDGDSEEDNDLLTTSLLLVYLRHFVLSILFLQIFSSLPVSLLPHHYPPHYLYPLHLSDKAIFLSASEKNSSFLGAGRHS